MTAYKFAKLPPKKKERIILSVVRATNKDQKELMKKFKLSFTKGA